MNMKTKMFGLDKFTICSIKPIKNKYQIYKVPDLFNHYYYL